MKFVEGEIYHIYNRGNNSQNIFFNKDNYLFFLKKLRKELLPYCEILAYCMMPNHFHLMVMTKSSDNSKLLDDSLIQTIEGKKNLNTGIAILLRSYTRAIQKQENIKGSLFQQKTKAQALTNSKNLGLNHPAICMHYIHQNPLRGGLVSNMEGWPFSSFRDYAGLRNGTLCNKAIGLLLTGIQKEFFVKESYEVMANLSGVEYGSKVIG